MDTLVSDIFEVRKQEIIGTCSKKLKAIEEEILKSPDALINPGRCAENILDVLTESVKEIIDALINSYQDVQEKIGEKIILEKQSEIVKESSRLVNSEINRIRAETNLLWKVLFGPGIGFTRQEDFDGSLRECMGKIADSELELISRTKKKVSALIETEKRKETAHQSLRETKRRQQKIHLCGPLAKLQCDLEEKIEGEFSDKNVFLDIPYSNYDDCEEVLRLLLKELNLNAVVSKDRITSNDVLCKVCTLIKTCKYGITDISSASNSVSYEYGLMHGLGMKVCLLIRSESEKFTDIHGLEHIPYDGLRTFKIAIAKWILHNIEEVDKAKVNQIIESEEKVLKETGDIPLKRIELNLTENEKESQIFKSSVINNIKENANKFKGTLQKEPYRIIYSVPSNLKSEIITTKTLFEKRDTCILFPNSSAEFPCSIHKLEKSPKALKYTSKNEQYSSFCYFEWNIFGIVFFEKSILEYKDNPAISIYVTIDKLYKFVLLISTFYEKIGYSGQIDLNYEFQNVLGLKLLSKDNWAFPFEIGQIKYDNYIPIKKIIKTDDLRNKPDDIILDIYEELRFSANAEEPYNRDKTKWQLEEVKWELYGKDVCPVCNKTYKLKNQNKCLNCLIKDNVS